MLKWNQFCCPVVILKIKTLHLFRNLVDSVTLSTCTCTNTNDVTPIQVVSSLQQIVLHILSNDCVANLTCGVLGTQSDTPGQLAIGNWHLLWRRFLLGLALDPHSQKNLHMQTQLLHLHFSCTYIYPPTTYPSNWIWVAFFVWAVQYGRAGHF